MVCVPRNKDKCNDRDRPYNVNIKRQYPIIERSLLKPNQAYLCSRNNNRFNINRSWGLFYGDPEMTWCKYIVSRYSDLTKSR